MFKSRFALAGIAAIAMIASTTASVGAHPDDGVDDGGDELDRHDSSAELIAHDAATAGIVSSGPFANVTKNLADIGRGVRDGLDATTDVWAHDGYAYTGTFSNPCGGDPEAGIWVWDVHNKNKPTFEGVIQSPTGSRTNDVKVASMNSGAILVHSNEQCGVGGVGGFEIYNVDDPTNPVFLAHVQVDEIAEISPLFFAPGALEDNGVHNLFLFTQDGNDYVAAQSEGVFDGFQIFDITDPANPSLVSGWGAEEAFDPGVGDLTLAEDPTGSRTLDSILWLRGDPPFSGFGASDNRFLHDFTISADGTTAYLAHWDAGLITLDISDVANPTLVSVALDPVNGSLDGEVNSHSVWPSEDGTIVIEGEEDFSAWEGSVPPSPLTMDGPATPGDPQIPGTAIATNDGDLFENSQTGNIGSTDGTSVEVTSGPLAGTSVPAIELSTAPGSPTFATTGTVTGELVWIGRACTLTGGDALENLGALDPGDIAVVRRGACEFDEKAQAAGAAGAAAIVIANQQPGTPWSGMRIWDYSDPANPILASTFDTACSAAFAPNAECDAAGTYSSHNVIVETQGNKVMAYISWYWDGVVVLDISDPYNPIEVARYLEDDGPLHQDFWGIYKEPNSPFIYASDRSGGLYILKQFGAGSAKNGK